MRRWMGIRAVVAVLAIALPAAWPSPAPAQVKVPSRPVQFIVPWAAGGGTDRIARMVAVLLEKDLGQPVTVVNRTGGGGMLGHTAGATAQNQRVTTMLHRVPDATWNAGVGIRIA
jgi:tripartite-type tricarboxylate transporter receptor subunit TctC